MRYVLFFLLAAAPLAAKDSCLDCHTAMQGDLQTPATQFRGSIHMQEGLTCAGCHGGDPNSDDPQVAMSRARGFIGVPARTAIPKLCAHCHSDPNFMRKFNPSERVDQYAEYVTSVHGQRIAQGDAKAATCIDCHGVHDILPVRDPRGPVYPTKLPATCAHCHADAAYMASYKIPTDQYSNYLKSVHWEELSKRGDLSAPNCATCHGNHGAKPPQASSVAAVCGTCHVVEEQLFQKSPHQPVFEGMGGGACTVCHSNHAVLRATDRLLTGNDAVCAQCHEPDSAGGQVAAKAASLFANLQSKIQAATAILNQAQDSGMEVSDAILSQRDAEQALIKARQSIHNFAVAPIDAHVQEGLKIANADYQAGQNALHERNIRREGLVISLAFILLTMVGLGLALRWIKESRSRSSSQ